MIFKTPFHISSAYGSCLKSHHPYQTPELLVLPVTHGDTDCLSTWLSIFNADHRLLVRHPPSPDYLSSMGLRLAV